MVTEGAGGRVIAGRYRLLARLGRGGMGVVWRAVDELLGRQVAVKELPGDDTLSAAEARRRRERTLREARAVAQLSHPHIIVVHDVVDDDERTYIVMELLDGGSLADRIAGQGPVGPAEAARIGLALLGALRTAHTAGVLHRDVKPSNVLVAEDGRVVLTDFGVAQVPGATTLTESGAFVGSPEYTAPERMSGGRAGPESDLWSLGALLCTVLSGESPFHRDSLGGILHAVVTAEIEPPPQAGPLLPVIRGLLERDPRRRLDAAGAEGMLRTYLATGRTTAPGGSGRRRSKRAMLTVALLAAATAGAGAAVAALLIDGAGDGGGDPLPTTSAPDQAPPGDGGPAGSPTPVPTATVTVTRVPTTPPPPMPPPTTRPATPPPPSSPPPPPSRPASSSPASSEGGRTPE
ncbi:serine/threonine protein kinase [Streptomyces daghestanicus]|uniref:non-specific serine/threonine protein kinase n=1 Tax=Streptomyces daghestanicus TaxID=66885 RepID=A0ABQ3Q2D3_9ACTN|nr:serine/threonine protein kinase [Streptomyces daghestanicus]